MLVSGILQYIPFIDLSLWERMVIHIIGPEALFEYKRFIGGIIVFFVISLKKESYHRTSDYTGFMGYFPTAYIVYSVIFPE